MLRTMGDFLDTLPFLSPEQRAALRAEDLDTAVAFVHVPISTLQAAPFSLTLGKASRLLAAAQDERAHTPTLAPPPAPQTVHVSLAEPLSMQARIERALAAAEADPSTAGALLDLGVEHVVIGAHGKVWPAATIAMRAHAASGAPVGKTWQGAKIASVRSLSTPVVLCSPRTGRPLQDGKDEVTETPWGMLGLDGLRLAAFGYEQDMFAGMSEDAVLSMIAGGKDARAKIEKRMAALDVKPEDMDPRVVFTARIDPAAHRPDVRPPSTLRGGQATGGTLLANLTRLLLAMFSADELRRFLRYQPGGADFVGALPGSNCSPADFAFAAADRLIRHGMLTRDLRNALVAERPNRAAEIDTVFSAAGVL